MATRGADAAEPCSAGWRYRILGPLQVEWGGTPIALGVPQARAVLAVLLLNANQVVSLGRLADELWGDTPPASARVQVQGLISRLRRAMRDVSGEPVPPIETRRTGYLIRVEPGQLDLDQFEDNGSLARRLIARGETAAGARLLRDALDSWRGSAFSDIDAPAACQARESLGEQQLNALEDCIEAELSQGRHRDLVAQLTELIEQYPFRERPCGQLMTALARSGRVAEALELYQSWRGRLVDELGVEPSPALRSLNADILRAEAWVRPESASLPGRRKPPAQLPADLPDFTGRQRLLDELAGYLSCDPDRGTPPVVSVTGGAGTGKTALAVRLAHRLRPQYPDGQLFVRLGAAAGQMPASVVLPRLLRALRVPVDLVPADVDECADLFRDLVAGRRLLLVLDDAGTEGQVRPLLPAEPGCAVVVTSRHQLTALEHGKRVELDTLGADEATELLARLAGEARVAAEPDSAAAIVAFCGRLPLALRIVGARLAGRPHWTLADLAGLLAVEQERLNWLQVGDLAVRSSFAVSYGQLAATQQTLLRGLAELSAPDFASWVPAAVLDTDPTTGERMLDDLVRCHVVQPAGRRGGHPRHHMHDLVRLFAREAAATDPAGGRTAMVSRALAAWLALAERAADRLPGGVLRPAPGLAPRWQLPAARANTLVADPVAWFDAELGALHGAVTLAAASGLGELAWELAVAMSSYFDQRGRYAEWMRCHQVALPAAEASGCVRGQAALLLGLGQLQIYLDDFLAAQRVYEESRWLSELIGDIQGAGRALAGLASQFRLRGAYGKAMDCGSRALGLLTKAGDRHGEIQMHTLTAMVHLAQGRIDDAERWLDGALWRSTELGDKHRIAWVLQRYGELHLARNDSAQAIVCLHRALDTFDGLDDQRCAANSLTAIGRAQASLGQPAKARATLLRASSLYIDMAFGSGEATCARLLAQMR